ncbi:M15 family metallopeptidase [Robiginitalea aurantiaca]|uniref:M15 family metallopeptidase n=1 Tax=Robiginitalea aurantiaca TaxID=3056915 RepID=A0ABT7WIL7_9FLAO|nr:M15 family metallopeptidase [Robiginitalea aurantiaca]MDM9632740.1 M15 family metallopeptidase [Robiginitalea aurantiaca]
MNRRNFLIRGSLGSLAFTLPLNHLFAQEQIYSVEELTGKADIELFGEGINLRKEAHDAFIRMKKAAYQDGIDIKVVSSFRDYERQRGIFERKYINYTEEDGMEPLEAVDEIVKYSTIPGTSRHHWGTDADLVDGSKRSEGDLLVPDKFEAGGPFEDFKVWMDDHSEEYGFYLVYTDNPKRRGFKYEPWHYSYAPLSIPMLSAFRKMNIMKILEKDDFLGSEHLTTGFIRNYITGNILDINPDLL